MILAQRTVEDLFGKVTPPPGAFNAAPAAGLGKLLATSIQLFLIVTAFTMLFFLFWGGFDWVISRGEKERIEAAQNKITSALLGLGIVIASLTIFTYIVGHLLGLIQVRDGFQFNIPTLQDVTPTPRQV